MPDASWEADNQAWRDQEARYQRCDALVCQCPNGSKYNDGSWEIIVCSTCGSYGIHEECNNSKIENFDNYECPNCDELTQKLHPPNDESSNSNQLSKIGLLNINNSSSDCNNRFIDLNGNSNENSNEKLNESEIQCFKLNEQNLSENANDNSKENLKEPKLEFIDDDLDESEEKLRDSFKNSDLQFIDDDSLIFLDNDSNDKIECQFDVDETEEVAITVEKKNQHIKSEKLVKKN